MCGSIWSSPFSLPPGFGPQALTLPVPPPRPSLLHDSPPSVVSWLQIALWVGLLPVPSGNRSSQRGQGQASASIRQWKPGGLPGGGGGRAPPGTAGKSTGNRVHTLASHTVPRPAGLPACPQPCPSPLFSEGQTEAQRRDIGCFVLREKPNSPKGRQARRGRGSRLTPLRPALCTPRTKPATASFVDNVSLAHSTPATHIPRGLQATTDRSPQASTFRKVGGWEGSLQGASSPPPPRLRWERPPLGGP